MFIHFLSVDYRVPISLATLWIERLPPQHTILLRAIGANGVMVTIFSLKFTKINIEQPDIKKLFAK